jgi:hypothetical protein
MATLYLGMNSGSLSLFRKLPRYFKLTPTDQLGNTYVPPTGSTGTMTVTTSISPDAGSILHTFTDLYLDTDNTLRKDFSVADLDALPLGSYFAEVVLHTPADGDYPVAQIGITMFPVQKS